MNTTFARWFGAALVAHVVGNWTQPDLPTPVGVVNLLVGLVGLGLVFYPGRSLLLVGSAMAVSSLLLEIPFTGNHWVVAALASAAILLAGGDEQRYAPAVRSLFLVFYAFAAFAKINSAFFDPSVSCAVFYGNQALDGFGLAALDPTSLLARLLVLGTAAIELSVVPLLAVKRTRHFGVLLAAGFHTLISFDLNQHFYDFTTVILAMLVLFLPPGTEVGGTHARLAPRLVRLLGFGLGGLLVAISVLPTTDSSVGVLQTVPFLVWVPISLWWLARLIRGGNQARALRFRPAFLPGLAVALTVLNGLTPYTELKTAFSFNMYSNLVTAGGESNHFLIRSTLPLRNSYEGPVEVIETSDPGLDLYRQRDYLIAYPQLVRYLGNRPVELTYRRGSSVTEVWEPTSAGPWWWHWLPLRSLDERTPARCQDTFLPAL